MPTNLREILDWVRENRPDIPIDSIKKIMEANDVVLLIAAIAFEAGRTFQHNNPMIPLGSTN